MRAPGEVSRRIFDVCFVCLEARPYLSQRHRQLDSLATVKISSVMSFRYREEDALHGVFAYGFEVETAAARFVLTNVTVGPPLFIV